MCAVRHRPSTINGTPVLDIKPYYPKYDQISSPVVPDWVDELMKDYFRKESN